MKGSYHDPHWTEKITVPVKRVGNGWEFLYGGDVPVKEGTIGELTVNIDRIIDEDFRARVTQGLIVKVLDEGAPLMVALSCPDPDRFPFIERPRPHPLDAPAGATCFVRVRLGPSRVPLKPEQLAQVVYLSETPDREQWGLFETPNQGRGGLFLKLRGLDRCELHGSTVELPNGLPEARAVSLNHAFTLLSQTCETDRISNTGNIYTRMFYQDSDGGWYPLDDLRKGAQALSERRLVRTLWSEVEKRLGWRPAPPVERPRRRK